MRIYETTFIINPQTDDASISREIQSVTSLIAQNGGRILHEDRLGTRRLAYEIKRQTHGYYTSIIFEATAPVLQLLERHFRLGEAYLRNLTVLCERDLKELTAPEEAVAADQETKKTKAAAPPEKPSTDEMLEPETEEEVPIPEGQPAEALGVESAHEPPAKTLHEEFEEEEEL
jgi:small subunit ribosomal protein S6